MRHTTATAIRELFSIEAAKVLCGHRSLSATEIYAERDLERAREIMGRMR